MRIHTWLFENVHPKWVEPCPACKHRSQGLRPSSCSDQAINRSWTAQWNLQKHHVYNSQSSHKHKNEYKTHHVKNHQFIKKNMLLSSPLSKTRKSCQGPGEGFFRQLCSVEVVDSFGLLDVYALKTSLVDAYRKLFLAKYGKTWSRHNCSATSMEQQRDEDKGL